MFIQSLIKSDSGEAEQEDEVELLSKQDRDDYNVMPHFKNRVSTRYTYRALYFRGRVTNLNQSEARKQCFLASDWLKFETHPRKYRTLLIV